MINSSNLYQVFYHNSRLARNICHLFLIMWFHINLYWLKDHFDFVFFGCFFFTIIIVDSTFFQTDVSTLKKFLHILKQALNKEEINNIAGLDNILKVNSSDIEKPKTKMTILSRKDYPIKNGFPSSLESLAINSCVLQRMDARILKLKNLNTLDLSRNKLVTLPDSLDTLQNLRSLDLSHNQMQDIPECISRGGCAEGLRFLDLSFNEITCVPRRIQAMRNLNSLKMNNNNIESLPHSLGSMKDLRRLEISNNQLLCLPWSFTQLEFDFLDVSGNLFKQMTEGLVTHFQDGRRDITPASLMEICCRHVAVRYKSISFLTLYIWIFFFLSESFLKFTSSFFFLRT